MGGWDDVLVAGRLAARLVVTTHNTGWVGGWEGSVCLDQSGKGLDTGKQIVISEP